MRAAVLLILAFGTAAQPDVPGEEDHADAALDFMGAWFETAEDGVRFFVSVRAADSPPPQHAYYVAFQLEGARYVALVAFDGNGIAHSYLGPPDFSARGVPPPARMGNDLRDERFEHGAPATVSARLAWDALGTPGLAPGKTLADLYGGTGTHHDGVWDDEDGRQTTNAYLIEVPPRVPTAVVFGGGALLLIALVAAGIVAGKKLSRQMRGPPP